MDQMIIELRHKASDSEVAAAQYHLKCLRFHDDMVRIVNQQTIKNKLRTLSARRKTIFQSQDSTGSNPPTDRSYNSSAYFYGPRKFDKRNNFSLWQVKMLALLSQQGLAKALNGR